MSISFFFISVAKCDSVLNVETDLAFINCLNELAILKAIRVMPAEMQASFLDDVSSKTYQKLDNMSLVMRKPAFCICEKKDADQLRSNCAADQRLCFRYTDSTIHLLPKSEISSL